MPDSLYSPDFQDIYDRAVASAGTAAGCFPSPPDWRDQSIYFLMVDRFNNPAAPPRHTPFDDPGFDGYQGGTFAGVREKLPYIKDLGAGAIWLSPVLKNLPFASSSYHGYGIHDFLRAEPRFASNPANADGELRDLVDAAHAVGLYVIFDIVLNHTGDLFAYRCTAGDQVCQDTAGSQAQFHADTQPVEWRDAAGVAQPNVTDIAVLSVRSSDALVWPKELQQNGFFRRQGGMPAPDDDTVGDFASLKQMLTADPRLQAFLIRAYQYVIARFDIDGFRTDTFRYLRGQLPLLFGNAIREFALSIGKKNFFTFGEIWDQNAEQDIARFIGRNTNSGGDMVGIDAALDYPLFNNLKPVVKGFAAPAAVIAMYQFRKGVEQDVLSSHGDATRFFVTFLDNHDVKERMRFIDPSNQGAQDDEVTAGLVGLFALPGIPCVYYGTEQGLHGRGSDPAVREALWGGPGFDENSPFYRAIREIASVRANQAALRYGRFYFRPISGDGENFGVSPYPSGVLAFSRILNDAEVIVAINTSKSQSQSLYVILDRVLNPKGKSVRLLYSNKAGTDPLDTVEERSNTTVHEVDGTTSNGTLNAVRVTLQPMEAQILR
jgi:glycosidase